MRVVLGLARRSDTKYAYAASGNDFKKINSQKNSIEVAVVRSGKQIVVKNTDVLVGEVLLLNTGDKVCSLT